jgi:hypothetical protein
MGNLFDALRDEEDNISEHAYWRNYQRSEKRGVDIVAWLPVFRRIAPGGLLPFLRLISTGRKADA